jgi:hypothetical protein
MRQRPAEPSTIASIASLSDPLKFGHASTTCSSNRKSGDESGDHPSRSALTLNGQAVGSIPTAGAIAFNAVIVAGSHGFFLSKVCETTFPIVSAAPGINDPP